MKTNLITATLSGLLLACACGNPDTILPAQLMTTHHATRQLTLRTGETKSILLDEPAEPGYNWYYAVSADWVISMTEPYDYPARSGSPSVAEVPKQKVFLVAGLKPGKVSIRFYQMNPAQPNGVNHVEINYAVEVI